MPTGPTTPYRAALPGHVTTLRAADGVPLWAGHRPGPTRLGIVVAHGLTGSAHRTAVRRVVQVLSRCGGVVSFDFRGHGRSGGHSTVGDLEILDLAAAVNWARRLGYAHVATVGFSMGAAVALRHAAAIGGVAAVAAISGPARWYYRGTAAMRRAHWVIESRWGRLTGRVLRRTRIAASGWQPEPEPPHEAAARIAPTPLLLVHGDRDRLFPVTHAQALYRAAGEPKQLWIEPGFGHAEASITPDLLRRIGDWLHSAAGVR
jgi:pimeloyl-ACP methyl ester carboxylesterase